MKLLLVHSSRGATMLQGSSVLFTTLGCALIITEMKEINLSKGYKTQVDDEWYDPLNKLKWLANEKLHTVYACSDKRSIKKGVRYGCDLKMHRVIMGVTDPKIQVDHIDGDGLNNQRSNLRLCDFGTNQLNCKSAKGSSSQYVGVSYSFRYGCKKHWESRISVNKKYIFHGYYFTEYEAALARDQFILDNNLEFPKLNILTRP